MNDDGTTTSARGTRSASGRIEIQASPERVWTALTDAADLVRWFPLEARVDPGDGGSIFMSWKNEFAAESKIIGWDPPRRLAISWGWGDEAETQPQVTEYRIEKGEGGITRVDVVTSGFPDDPAWDGWVEGTKRGWRFELRSLKEYLEHHDGEDRGVVYLRRRTSLGLDEVWERLSGDAGLAGLAPNLNPLRGRLFDADGSLQHAGVLASPDGALFRVSNEPCMDPDYEREIVLWLQAWGEERDALPAYETAWSQLLERLFPEGEAPA